MRISCGRNVVVPAVKHVLNQNVEPAVTLPYPRHIILLYELCWHTESIKQYRQADVAPEVSVNRVSVATILQLVTSEKTRLRGGAVL
jgi:hypothetical protein